MELGVEALEVGEHVEVVVVAAHEGEEEVRELRLHGHALEERLAEHAPDEREEPQVLGLAVRERRRGRRVEQLVGRRTLGR